MQAEHLISGSLLNPKRPELTTTSHVRVIDEAKLLSSCEINNVNSVAPRIAISMQHALQLPFSVLPVLHQLGGSKL
jgi:hypothetical protein